MKREPDQQSVGNDAEVLSNEELSQTYRSLAVESTPRHLDQAVLAASRSDPVPDRGNRSWGAWLGPLAMLGIAGLGIVVVLELGMNTASESVSPTKAEMGGSTGPMPARDVDSALSIDTTVSCDEDQTRDESAWVRCIDDLRKRGFADAAENELLRFREAHPD